MGVLSASVSRVTGNVTEVRRRVPFLVADREPCLRPVG